METIDVQILSQVIENTTNTKVKYLGKDSILLNNKKLTFKNNLVMTDMCIFRFNTLKELLNNLWDCNYVHCPEAVLFHIQSKYRKFLISTIKSH
jgi:hypothetical protein